MYISEGLIQFVSIGPPIELTNDEFMTALEFRDNLRYHGMIPSGWAPKSGELNIQAIV